MNRNHWHAPHQSSRDARVYGKTGRIQPALSPHEANRHARLISKLAGMVGMCAGAWCLAWMLARLIASAL